MRTTASGRAAARFDNTLFASALLAAAVCARARDGDAANPSPSDVADTAAVEITNDERATPSPISGLADPAPADRDETLSTDCPEDDLSVGCLLRRADARVRHQLAGNGLLRIVWHGLLMFDLAGPNSDITDNNNVQLRRARIGFERPFEAWTVRGYAEYKTGRFEIEEVYARREWLDGTVTLGNQAEPVGLERVSSVTATTQLERALPAALTPGLNFGAAYARRDGNWYWSVGGFASGSANDGLRSKGTALDGRLVHAAVDADHVRHFGAALSLRPQSSDREIQFRSVPEVALSNVYLVDTGAIDNVDHVRRAGLEYAETAGAWSWQAESMATHLSRTNDDLVFRGAYAEISWFPWGGRRHYDAKEARFTDIVDVGRATWQFSARLSRLDLSSREVDGGRETNLTLAANWYVTQHARIGANLVKVLQLDGGPFGGDTHGDYAFVMRLQYDLF